MPASSTTSAANDAKSPLLIAEPPSDGLLLEDTQKWENPVATWSERQRTSSGCAWLSTLRRDFFHNSIIGAQFQA
jgi:hypothetical protein